MNNEILDAALKYAANDIAVFPLHTPLPDGGCSCGKESCIKSAGKHPRILDWQNKASKDESQVREWWLKWPNANVGVATGSLSGLFVLDVDGKKGADSLQELLYRYGPLPANRDFDPCATSRIHGWIARLFCRRPRESNSYMGRCRRPVGAHRAKTETPSPCACIFHAAWRGGWG